MKRVVCGVWPFVLSGFHPSSLVSPKFPAWSSLSLPVAMLLLSLPLLPSQMSLYVAGIDSFASAWDIQAQNMAQERVSDVSTLET